MVPLENVFPGLVARYKAPSSLLLRLERQGNFSLALLYGNNGVVCSFGIAKRNVCDKEQTVNGYRLATARALRRLRGGDEG